MSNLIPDQVDYHKYKNGEDTAAYLVDPGTIRAPGRHSAGNLTHARPYIVSGRNFFAFPVGPEGFSRSGSSGISIHKYLNEVAVDAHVFHREEGRIGLRGTFPGITAQDNMVACLQILRSKPPTPGLILYAPGVFEREQYVVAENWEFDHAEDDRTHSITYNITFVRSGEGINVRDPKGTNAPPNPSVSRAPKGKPTRFFVVVEGARTIKQIAFFVYHDSNKWRQIVALNQGQLSLWNRSNVLNQSFDLPTYQIATYRWPLGTKFRY